MEELKDTRHGTVQKTRCASLDTSTQVLKGLVTVGGRSDIGKSMNITAKIKKELPRLLSPKIIALRQEL